MSYYITAYKKYPIYEPAEGGYFYSGIEVQDSILYQSWKKAKRELRKCHKECVLDGTTSEPGWFENPSKQHFGWNGKYIGEGWYVKLERKQGEDICGWQPYE